MYEIFIHSNRKPSFESYLSVEQNKGGWDFCKCTSESNARFKCLDLCNANEGNHMKHGPLKAETRAHKQTPAHHRICQEMCCKWLSHNCESAAQGKIALDWSHTKSITDHGINQINFKFYSFFYKDIAENPLIEILCCDQKLQIISLYPTNGDINLI